MFFCACHWVLETQTISNTYQLYDTNLPGTCTQVSVIKKKIHVARNGQKYGKSLFKKNRYIS